MRLNINLASQKYEALRSFTARATLASAILVVTALILAVLAWFNYLSNKSSNARIRGLEQKIARLQEQRAAAEAVENRPENRDVTQQKNFWNKQIAGRAFSWTQLFNDLQRIMPARAYVISVAPELTSDNRVKLKLTIGGEKHDDVLELVKRMESSPKFRQVTFNGEAMQKEGHTGGPPLFKFEIETYYHPAAVPQSRTGSREGL